MKRLRNLIIWFGFLGSVIGVLHYYGANLLHQVLQVQLERACDCDVEIGSLQWRVQDPLNLQITKMELNPTHSKIQLGKLGLALKPTFKFKSLPNLKNFMRLSVTLDVGALHLEHQLSDQPPSPTAEESPVLTGRTVNRYLEDLKGIDLNLAMAEVSVLIRPHGQAKVNPGALVTVPDGTLSLKLPKLTTQWRGGKGLFEWSFLGSLIGPWAFLKGAAPFASQGKLQKNGVKIEIVESSISLLSLPLGLSGTMDLEASSADLGLKLNTKELASLPFTDPTQTLKSWSGALDLEIRAQKENFTEPWTAHGKMKVENLKTEIAHSTANEIFKGTPQADLNIESSYSQKSGLNISRLNWNINLTDVHLGLPGIFSKPTQSKLLSTGSAKYDGGVSLEQVGISLGAFSAQIDGRLRVDKSADLHFQIPKFSLNGMESFFPFMQKMPLTGNLEMEGHWQGSPDFLEETSLSIKKILAENVRGNIDWKSESTEISGPLFLNLDGFIDVIGKNVRKGQMTTKVDLSSMVIKYKNLFHKPAKDPFQMEFTASQGEGTLKVKQGFFRGPFGNLALRGVLPIPPLYGTNLKIESEQINFAPLRKWFPSFESFIPEGRMKPMVSLVGSLNPSDFLNSKLMTLGTLKVWIPQYKLLGKPQGTTEDTSAGPAVVTALLPSYRVLQSLALDFDLKMDSFQWRDLHIKDIHVLSTIREGRVQGTSTLGSFLGGKVEVTRFDLGLFDMDPLGLFQVGIDNLNVAAGLAIFLPPYKELVTGTFSGRIKGQSRLPSSQDFLADLQCAGQFNIKEATLKTASLKDLLVEKTNSIPGVGDFFKNLKINNTNLILNSQFELATKNLKLNPLKISWTEGHQLEVNGSLGFDLNAKLQGPLSVAHLQNRGSFFDANKDSQGRLVIPLRLDGSLLKPDLMILNNALSIMVDKAVDYEKNRAISSVQKSVEQKLQGENQKIQRELKGKVEGELKKLFGR